MQMKGISERVDSCCGLISKTAYSVYNNIPTEHRRWIDPEDVIQDGLLTAVQSQSKYDGLQAYERCLPRLPANCYGKFMALLRMPVGSYKHYKLMGPFETEAQARAVAGDLILVKQVGEPLRVEERAKYSTYLYNALVWMGAKEYLTPLQQQKRNGRHMVELDAMDPEDLMEIPDPKDFFAAGSELDDFRVLCSQLSSQAIFILIRVLLCQDFVVRGNFMKPTVLMEIRRVADSLGLGWTELAELTHMSEKKRKYALTTLCKDDMIDLGAEASVKILECSECSGRFSLEDVREKRFYVDSMTCRHCYSVFQKAAGSCFGKPKGRREGYEENDPECKLYCRDRTVCRQIVKARTC